MSLAHRYNDLTEPDAFTEAEKEVDSDAETKLEIYESGYQAGWQDAVDALEAEHSRVSAEFAQNLSDMAFTYQEARHKVLQGFRPIITAILGRVLPDLRAASLRSILTDQIMNTLDQTGERLIDLVTAPSDSDWVKSFLDQQKSGAFAFSVDTALVPGQIILRSSAAERVIDLDALLQDISAQMDTFFDNSFEVQDHG